MMPARGVALDVVDVRLVERPGVDQALGPGLLVVDRAAVEAERLGRPVVVAGRRARRALAASSVASVGAATKASIAASIAVAEARLAA